MICVVDDDCEQSAIIQRIVQSLGFKCNVTNSLSFAVHILSKPDILIVDAMLIDRLQATLTASRTSNAAVYIPKIIGVISEPCREMQEVFLKFGFSDILIKPIYPDSLYECICYLSCHEPCLSGLSYRPNECNFLKEDESKVCGHNLQSVSAAHKSKVSEESSAHCTNARKRACSTSIPENSAKIIRTADFSLILDRQRLLHIPAIDEAPTLCVSPLAMLA